MIAAATCPTCQWDEATVELIDNPDGYTIASVYTCNACTQTSIISHDRT